MTNINELWVDLYGSTNPPDNIKWMYIRGHANRLLLASDWTQLPDARITPAKKEEWFAYRELLSSIEARYSNPDDVIFPDPPADIRTDTAKEAQALESAVINAKKVVSIKTLTPQQARGWLHKKLNGEVSPAAEDAIGVILDMVIALRDKTMPDL